MIANTINNSPVKVSGLQNGKMAVAVNYNDGTKIIPGSCSMK